MKALGDRYPIEETPESAQEYQDLKQAAYERAIEHADILRDELRDRQADERETAHNV
jgi:hypothetical protein